MASSRQIQHRADVKQQLIDAARELFAKHGVDTVSMRKIADAVNYSPAAIYLHFPDKLSLLHAICRQDFAALGASFQKIAKVTDPIERIRQSGAAYIRFAVKHPSHYRVMFMTPVDPRLPDEEDRDAMQDPSRDGYAFLRHAVVEAIATRRLRPELTDVELVCQTFWQGVHGVASLTITHANDPCIHWAGFERRVNTMLDALIRGMTLPDRKGSER
jgi:AcrR family transcriptional regulator